MNRRQPACSSESAEQYLTLTYKLLNLMRRQARNSMTLGVTSIGPGEGVSSVASHLALTMSNTVREKVLMVDTKPDNITLSGMLASAGNNPKRKAREQGEIGYYLVKTNTNVDMILARTDDGKAESGCDMNLLMFSLRKARERYNYIIFDCPALSEDSITSLIASNVDGMILVVEAGKVRNEVLRREVEELRGMGANILGLVLNKRRYPIPNFIYNRL